jgi:DNA-directed RNA polymerase sigma subunit (sigma70/sigma32)
MMSKLKLISLDYNTVENIKDWRVVNSFIYNDETYIILQKDEYDSFDEMADKLENDRINKLMEDLLAHRRSLIELKLMLIKYGEGPPQNIDKQIEVSRERIKFLLKELGLDEQPGISKD